jgi:hypothetical protein
MSYINPEIGDGSKTAYCDAIRDLKRIKGDLKRTGKSKSYLAKVYSGTGCPTGKTRCGCCKWDRINKKHKHINQKRDIKNMIIEENTLN